MDASRSTRVFVAVGNRVSAAAIHSVSTTTVVGLDEIRGSAPDHLSGLLALGKSRAPPTPVRPFMPSSTFALAARGSLSGQDRSHQAEALIDLPENALAPLAPPSSHRRAVGLATAEQGPEDPRRYRRCLNGATIRRRLRLKDPWVLMVSRPPRI